MSETVTIRNAAEGIQIAGTKTQVAPGVTAIMIGPTVVAVTERHDISEYLVPVDPMDELQCDSCQ